MIAKTTDPTTTTLENLDSGGGSPLTWIIFAAASFALWGLLYPVVITLVGGALFPIPANGSLIVKNAQVVGSSLIGQNFSGEKYFIGRPSAAGNGNDPRAMSGSNLAPSNPVLRARAEADSKAIAAREGIVADRIPVDLIAASGAGVDPHISPEAAEIQVNRVAKARGIAPQQVRDLVRANTQQAVFGALGMPRVNVLELNLALDSTAKP